LDSGKAPLISHHTPLRKQPEEAREREEKKDEEKESQKGGEFS